MNRETERPALSIRLLLLTVISIALSLPACSDAQTENEPSASTTETTEESIVSFPDYTDQDRQKNWCLSWEYTGEDEKLYRIPRNALIDELNKEGLVFRYITTDDTVMVKTSRVSGSEGIQFAGSALYAEFSNEWEPINEGLDIEMALKDKYNFTGSITFENGKVSNFVFEGGRWINREHSMRFFRESAIAKHCGLLERLTSRWWLEVVLSSVAG